MITELEKINKALMWSQSKFNPANIYHKFWLRPGYRLKKLVDFIRLGWTDEDWDYAHLLRLMRYKMDKLRIDQEKDIHHKNAHKHAQQLTICVNLIDRILEDDYTIDTSTTYNRKWDHAKGSLDFEDISGSPHKRCVFKGYESRKPRPEIEAYDRELLFKIMSKYIRHWWS